MKLVRDEIDDRKEEALRQEIKEAPDTLRFVNGNSRKYSISFEVIDEARANNFLGSVLLSNFAGNNPEIEEMTGIKFTSLNYDNIKPEIAKLREMLKQFDIQLQSLDEIN